jgi:hypothetical protein
MVKSAGDPKPRSPSVLRAALSVGLRPPDAELQPQRTGVDRCCESFTVGEIVRVGRNVVPPSPLVTGLNAVQQHRSLGVKQVGKRTDNLEIAIIIPEPAARHRAKCSSEILQEREAARAGNAQMEYPHWLIVAGTALLAIGFIGLAFRRNRDVEPNHEPTEMKASGKPDDGRASNADTLPPWPWRPPPQAR